MLLGQHGSGAEHGDLPAVHRDPKRRAHRDLGLAEPHVAADQPVHRLAFFEVDQHVLDRASLVVGLFEGEGGLELGVGAIGGRQHGAGVRRALRVELQELVGHLLDRRANLGLLAREGATAELVELRVRALPGEFLDAAQPRDRQKELVVAPVLDDEHFDESRRVAAHALERALQDLFAFDAAVDADAVVGVHHIVAGVELAKVFEERIGALASASLGFFSASTRARSEDLFFGDHHARFGRPDESVVERAERQLCPRLGEVELAQLGRFCGERYAVSFQKGREALGLRASARGEEHAHALVDPTPRVLDHRLEAVAAAHLPLGLEHRDERGLVERADLNHRVFFDRFERGQRRLVDVGCAAHGQLMDQDRLAGLERVTKRFGLEVQRVERVGRRALVNLRLAVELGAFELGLGVASHRGRIQQHGARRRGQVVERRFEPVVEGRQQAVDAIERASRLEIVEQRSGLGGGHVGRVAKLADASQRVGLLCRGDHRVAHRVNEDLVDRLDRALVVGVEELDRLDQPVVELDARREARVGRVDVDDPAPHGEGAGILGHRDADVSPGTQHPDEVVALELGLGLHEERSRANGVAWWDLAHERGARGDQKRPGQLAREMEEHRHAIHCRAPVGRDVEERRGVERGEVQHAPAAAHEKAQVVGEAQCGIAVGRHDHHGPEPLAGFGQEMRCRARRQAREIHAPTQGLDQIAHRARFIGLAGRVSNRSLRDADPDADAGSEPASGSGPAGMGCSCRACYRCFCF